MPQNLTDSDSFDTVSGPSAADVRNAASVRSALQTVANRTRWLYNRLVPVASITALKAIDTTSLEDGATRIVREQGVYHLATGSAAAVFEPFIVQPNVGPGRWLAAAPHRTTRTIRVWPGHHLARIVEDYAGTSLDFTTGTYGDTGGLATGKAVNVYGGIRMIDVAGSTNRNLVICGLESVIPDGVTITSVVATLQPATVASLPQQMPFLGVVRLNTGSPKGAHLRAAGVVVDGSATVGAYNASHTITLTPDQNNVVDRSLYGYELILGCGGGSNAVAGDEWRHVDITCTVPDARGE